MKKGHSNLSKNEPENIPPLLTTLLLRVALALTQLNPIHKKGP